MSSWINQEVESRFNAIWDLIEKEDVARMSSLKVMALTMPTK